MTMTVFHEDEYSLNQNLPGGDSYNSKHYRDIEQKFYSKYKPDKLYKLNSRYREDHEAREGRGDLSRNDLEKIHQELNSIRHKLVVRTESGW
jgi:hypothetical protein